MWRLIKFIAWTSFCLWLGAFLSTYQIGGQTAWQYARKAWQKHGIGAQIDRKVGDFKEGLQGAFDSTKDHLTGDSQRNPKERHTEQEREALNKLIANRHEK